MLVKEKIGESGVALLREHFDVELGIDWDDEQLAQRIGEYDGIVIRSATKLTAELIDRADRMKVVGRAGVGVDNVDVEAATRRGIVVANAPESNVVTAAEHTMALLLALARNIPQAYASLVAGRWDRSKYSGVELYEKTLGVLGFGRIGQLVAQRARGFGMRVMAFDPFVSAERYREHGVEKADSPQELYASADFLTIHLPKTPDTMGFLDADAFAAMRDGVRVLNVARGGLIDEDALKDALDSGKVAGAALDVFPAGADDREPAVRVPQRDRHPAPRRLHRRGDRPRRLPERRAGGGRAHRRGRLDGRQHPRDRRRGHGGAGTVPAAGHAARPPGDDARGGQLGRADRGGLPRSDRRLRHAPARPGGDRGRAAGVTPRSR